MRRRHARDTSTLTAGTVVIGKVKGVCDFGAFVHIGCAKDGLLHVSEMGSAGARVVDARDKLAVGDSVRVFVKAVDVTGKISLTARDPAVAELERNIREAARAAREAVSERERAARLAEREAATARERAAREAERQYHDAERQRLAEIEAAMAAEAAAREEAAAAARAAAVLLLPVASLLKGETPSKVSKLTPPVREVLVRKEVGGRELLLFKMEWKYA